MDNEQQPIQFPYSLIVGSGKHQVAILYERLNDAVSEALRALDTPGATPRIMRMG